MSLTRKIAHNSIIQIVGKIVSTSLGLIAIGMMTRYMGTEQFGWYTTAITFLQFAGILTDFGITTVTAQMMSEPEFEKQKLFHNILTFRILSAVFFFLLVPGIALFFPYPYPVKMAIALSSISFVAIAINQVFIGLLQTELKMHLYAIGEFIGRIVLIGGLFFLVNIGAGFLPIMGIITLSSMAFTFSLFLFIRQKFLLAFAFDPDIWKRLFQKMWPITLGIIFNAIYLKGDVLLLTLYRSQTEVGLYGASYRVIDIITQIAMMMMGILMPLLAYEWSRKNKEKFQEHFERTVFLMSMIGLPSLVGIYMLASPIMRLIAGPEFVESGRPLQILSLATFGLFLGAIFGHTAVAINRQREILWIYLTSAILTCAGYFIFIPKYGMIGAASMSVFSEMFVGICLLCVIGYYMQIRISLLPLAKIFFSAFCMGLALFFVKEVPVLFAILIAIAVYGSLLLLTKAISKETLKEVFTIKKPT